MVTTTAHNRGVVEPASHFEQAVEIVISACETVLFITATLSKAACMLIALAVTSSDTDSADLTADVIPNTKCAETLSCGTHSSAIHG